MAAPRRRLQGFTLVEVLVALAILATLAAIAWQGVEAIARSRTAGDDAIERTMRLQTILAQWEQDLLAIYPSDAAPALRFDGATLRMTRSTDSGVQVVAWTLRDGAMWRWSTPAVTRVAELQDYWMRSQQLLGNEPGTLRVLEGVNSIQIYFFRANAWTNAQSSGDTAPGGTGRPPTAADEALPSGVRLVLAFGDTKLTRDVVLDPQAP